MAKEKDFAKELNELITRYINMGCDPPGHRARGKFSVRPL
jgi:hypothetical protein